MATPVGHSLVAGMFYLEWNNKKEHNLSLMLFCFLFSNGPDLDFLPGIFIGNPGRFHHGLSHSLAFGVLITFITCIILKSLKYFCSYSFSRLAFMGCLLYISHLLLDLITLDDFFPYGIQALWPFVSEYITPPFYVFSNVARSSLDAGFHKILHEVILHNMWVALDETFVFLPPLLYIAANEKFFKLEKVNKWAVFIVIIALTSGLSMKINPFY